MARDWSEQPLGSLVEFVNGDRSKNYPSQADRVAVGVPFVNAGDLVDGYVNYNGAEKISGAAFDRLRSGKTRSGDILFCLRGTPGRTGRDRRGGVAIASSLVIIRPTQHVDRDYLYFMLSGPVFQTDCGTLNNGSAQPNVSVRSLSALSVCVPPVKEQRAIAGVLGALDDKIEQNRRTAQALEKLARAIFRAWFVDFEPVKAKAAGAASFPSMPQPVFDALPTGFVDSAIGQVPEGWEVGAVGDLCDYISSGGTPARRRPEFWADGTIDWFKTGELQDGPLLASSEHITKTGLDNSSAKLWPAGTILFALYASPTVGRLGVLTRPGTSNQAAAGLIAKPDVGVPFLMNALIEARAELQRIAVGAAQQNINQGVLKSHQLVSPPPELTMAFSGAMIPALETQVALAKETAKLAQMRDYLLPKLLSGQVRVRAAERITATVA